MKWWEQRLGSLADATLCKQCGSTAECDLHSCREVCPEPGAAWRGALSRIDKFNLCLP